MSAHPLLTLQPDDQAKRLLICLQLIPSMVTYGQQGEYNGPPVAALPVPTMTSRQSDEKVPKL